MSENNQWTTRRGVISTLGALLPAGVLNLSLANSVSGAAHPEGARTHSKFDYDVIVIGGGFAGATAAREIGLDGNRVLVLEARARLGGRTFRSKFLDHDIEFGGAWAHWAQPHIWAEIQRYGKGIEEEPLNNLDNALVMLADGGVERVPPKQLDTDARIGMEAFCAGARELFPRPYEPFFNPKVLAMDHLSAADRIASLKLTQIQKACLNAEMTLYGGGPTSQYSYMSFLKLYAAAAWDYFTFTDSEKHYRIGHGGTLGLCQAMIEHSRATVRMNSPVTDIGQAADHVSVVTEDGTKTTAAAVVITIPTNTYRNVKFSPGLSAKKMAYLQAGEMSAGAHLAVHLKQNIGNTFAFCDDPHPFNAVQTHLNDDKRGTILSVTIGRHSLIDLNDSVVVANELKKLFPGVDVLETSAYDWAADPFSLQAWPSYRAGQFHQYKDLAQQEGRLFFAGASTANGWHEYMDGAVESGIRAGREVREFFARGAG